MPEHYDARETESPAARDAALFARLPDILAAALHSPGYAAHLGEIDPAAITDRTALARLPVLRKSEMPEKQRGALPFGGFVP